MHCAGCMAKVERALGAVPGVTSARVNLTAKQARAEHGPEVEPAQLIAALDAVGFASQPRSNEQANAPSAVKPLLAPLAVAAFAAMNVMLLSVSNWSGAEGSTRELFHWVSAAIAVPAIAYSGMPFFRSAWAVLRKGRTNMDVPISIGIVLATLLSCYETVTGGEDVWFDGALMLIMFLLAGRTLDAMMRDKARAGVDALLNQAAPGASVISADGTLQWVAAADLLPGMVMRIAAGERLAADGEIVSGASAFDQSLLTGESLPIPAATGALVHAGTLNLDAPVDVRVTAAGADTSLAEIARLMDAADQPRSVYVRIADRASRLYAPAVHSLAALTFVGWLLAGAGVYHATVIAISVLIITCPCALGLAVPVAQVVASGALMKEGIMVKDGSAIERMAVVDRVLLDKTGSLTLGRPEPDTAALNALDGDAASVALGLASHSRHPHSRAIEAALLARGFRAVRVEGVAETAGIGLSGNWNGRKVSLGRNDAADVVSTTLRIEGRPDLLIPFTDRLRPDADAALGRMKAMGLDVSLLSGDNQAAVAEVADAVGLPAQAAASPSDKREAIGALQAEGHKVLMVGDGLNDGPALAAADASIAPGSASDVGRQAADLVFLGDSLMALPRAVLAARRTMRVVKQNFALAIGYNLLAVPLAIMGFVNPMIAAAAMSGSSLVVVANSLRLVRAAK
ncbi:MAG TPA: heavy metal translocating P-type ATPase [Novosphingobium sp.]|nr:heavy metal translocating P-type ATPase [Novosphingobium sp.]HQA17143.1 heavy metal translocating P-type ATPase [Novosphingobium sp.]